MASKTSFVTWKKIKSLIQTIAQTQLSEVLNMTNNKPILVRGDEDLLLHPHESSFWNTDFVGTKREIDFDIFTGMPKHLTQAKTVAIFRAIKNDTTIGRNVGTPHVLWTLPVHACTAMTTTFFDRQLPHDDEDRKVRCILRALPNFHNKLGSSNIKVAVEYETGVKIHFAKCVVFLKDNKDNYFVVVQWYDAVGRQPFDVRLCFWLTLGGFDFVASRRTQKLQFDAHQLYRQWRHNYTFRESIVGSLISERGKGL
jgi:hypothetical protein